MLTIRKSDGTALLTLESVFSGSKRQRTLMGDDCVTLKFALAEPVHIPVGAYADIEGERFEATEPQQPKQNAKTGGWEYDIQLDAQYVKWKNKIFKFIPENSGAEASWSLTAALSVHMGIFRRNLDALGYKFGSAPYTVSIDSTVSAEAKQLTYESCSLLDALYKMAEAYDCEAWVDESVIHFGKCQYNDIVDFEQDVNVETMTAEGNRAEYATRIYAFGSQKNLPDSYRPASSEIVVNGVAQRRLMLPEDTPCIDSKPGLTTAEAVEAVLVFEDVYPRTSSQMSDVTEKEYDEKDEDGNPTGEKWTAYRFKLPSFQFSESYMLPDTDLQIIFQTGSLSGMAFNVKFNPQDGYQLWEIIRNEDYGRPLPDAVLKPANDDRVVVVGWDSSQMPALGLIEAAEQELKQKAIAKVEELKNDPANYRCKMISAAMFDALGEWQPYSLGSRVRLINPGCFEDGSRESRIIGYEYDLARPFNSPVYVVGEKASASRIGSLEDKVEALTLAGQTYAGGNGSGVYVIRANDSTPPSDTNVYSALRTKRERLSRVSADTALEKIGFLKGLEVGDYEEGMLTGKGGAIDGKGNAELESLRVRSYLMVMELVISRLTALEADTALTDSDTIDAVERIGDEGDEYATYSLTLKSKWDGYFTAMTPGAVVKGVYNSLARAAMAGAGSASGTEDAASYCSSWMRVNAVYPAQNRIEVSLYKDEDVPAGSNHAPVADMKIIRIAHQSDTLRQSLIQLLGTERRIEILQGMTTPEAKEENYGVVIGKPTDFLKDRCGLTDLDNVVYAKRLIYETSEQLSVPGLHTIEYVQLNEWEEGGTYYCDHYVDQHMSNPNGSGDLYHKYVTHDVYHYGCRWRCVVDLTDDEPKWNSIGWLMIEGNPTFSAEFDGWSDQDRFDFDDFSLTLSVKCRLYNRDITADVDPACVQWTRVTVDCYGAELTQSDAAWTAQHADSGKTLTLTKADIGTAEAPRCITIRATVTLRDGTQAAAQLNLT